MRKLGRGLSELGLNELLGPQVTKITPETFAYDKIHHLPITLLSPGEYQPRRNIDETALSELADSIKAQGILQPIIVRGQLNNRYEIIAGERRWRAAQLAGLTKCRRLFEKFPIRRRSLLD